MKQYETFELCYHAPAPTGSHVEIDLTAAFTTEAGTVTVRGFYAGNERYIVRYLPMSTGHVSYTVSGLVSDTGTAEILPADTHGPVHAEGLHFKHADGHRYAPFGTTVYALAHQDPETTEDTFESLAGGYFNKLRLCLFPKHYNYNHNDPEFYPFEKDEEGHWDVHHPCFAFWDAFEEKLARLDSLGIQADLILFHSYDRWGFSHLGQKNNLVYLDYLVRRFAAFPHIWWSLANEYDLIYHMTTEDWMEIEEFMAAHDPYHHLLGNHCGFAFWNANRKNITHLSVQTRQLTRIAEYRERFHVPVVVDECCYEGNIPEFWGCISAKEMTNRFWRVVTTGGYCTHGETYLDPGRDILWWGKGGKLKGESPKRIAFLREIVESLPGPIDPVSFFMMDVAKLAVDRDREKKLEGADPGFANYVRTYAKLGYVGGEYYLSTEFSFMGHVGTDAYLTFYDLRCCAQDTLNLPEDRSYKVELIDTWNMTRTVIAEHVSGRTVIDLSGTEGMAVLATAEN